MKPLLYRISLLSLLPMLSSAAPTHLDIALPSRDRSWLNGPVKRIVEEYNYDMSDRKYKIIFEYDEAGNLTSEKKWDYKDELSFFVTNSFDSAGCFIRQRVENVRSKTTNDYEIIINVPTRQIAYKCDITGEIEVLTYSPAKYMLNSTIKRNGKKTVPLSSYKRGSNHAALAHIKHDEDGRVKYIAHYQRDELKRLIQSAIDYKGSDQKDRNAYEYLAADEYGNWTQRLLKIETLKDKEEKKYERFTTRQIDYYETPEL